MTPQFVTDTPDEKWLELVNSNRGKLGQYFKQLLHNYFGTQMRPVVGYFLRLRAYKNNDILKLIEMAEDYKAANQATVNFVDKYSPELFNSLASRWEREQVEFVDKVIIDLTRMIEQSRLQKS